ncbi:MAG: amino acid permease [Sumerlaeia bacterium]
MPEPKRHIGLFAATSIGVGAIVGGGILALAGTGFAAAGPAAILAFALNGVIAVVTALSFAELSSANPQSGGTYLFARRTLTVGAAFSVGWVVWFASIVASALYALGFASFAIGSVVALWPAAPDWLTLPSTMTTASALTVLGCTAFLSRSAGSGGNWINVLKVIVFGVLIAGGFVVWAREQPPALDRLTPFMPAGFGGVISAMGFTFIALQGFDLIAAVAGEVKEPRRVLPKAMLFSLGIALVVYLPLLLVVLVVGVPAGETITAMSEANPDTVVAIAARNYLGTFGFWLVMASGVLAMFSALVANIFAASRIAQAMGRDRTLPAHLERVGSKRGTPLRALWVTATLACATLVAVGDVAQAGAASSLIFLISFALTHVICILARRRRPNHDGFRLPGWPYLPAFGVLTCGALAVFQGFVVPAAGAITGVWLVAGFFCYLWIFGQRARITDAASELADPDLLELRGRSPLVLVPIANPSNAAALATLAVYLSPPRAGRVLLLNVVQPGQHPEYGDELDAMANVLKKSMAVSLEAGLGVECMASIAKDPWAEIERVARSHRCAMTLLGMSDLNNEAIRARVEKLASELPGNVAIVRSPPGWKPSQVRRVLVPLGGRGVHNALRARLLTAMHQRAVADLEICYLIVVKEGTSEAEQRRMKELWTRLVTDESAAKGYVEVLAWNNIGSAVLKAAKDCDLILLGLGQVDKRRRVLGNLIQHVAASTDKAVMLIGQRE